MKYLAPLLLIACATAPALAQFQDNFDTENGGHEAINYNNLTNWSVTGGTVDLIGNGGTYDFLPGHGLYIDLDGSTNDAGLFMSVLITLTPGQYELTYDLAGSQRSGSPIDSVQVDFGTEYSALHTLNFTDGFTTFSSGTFTVASTTTYMLKFQDQGNDNQGALLDNVSVQAVPAPASLGVIGLGGLLLSRRRR